MQYQGDDKMHAYVNGYEKYFDLGNTYVRNINAGYNIQIGYDPATDKIKAYVNGYEKTFIDDIKYGENSNGTWRILSDGTIIQTMPITRRKGIYNFPISFKSRVDAVIAANADEQGSFVDNAFAYPINLYSYYCATRKSEGTAGTTDFPSVLIAIGR